MASVAPPAPDLAGALLGGRYRVVRAIGRGGMGTVYEGLQEDLGRRVAIKVLHPHLATSADVVERFRREAQATGALGHPNIVQVTDCQWQPGGPLFLVMELLTGTSLGQVLSTQGRVDARRVAFIASQMLDALSAAHRAGIVHRDVKPDNVFLTSVAQVHDVVKVLDFGVAKLLGSGPDAHLTSTGVAIGTPFYMAPEQARGLSVDARTDVYAVGVCMYHAISGRVPFHAPSFNSLMFAIAEQTPVPLATLAPEVDRGLVAVVERAMAKDPAQRFASAAEMGAALARWSSPTTSIQAGPLRGDFADPNAATVAAPTPSFVSARPPNAITEPRRSASALWIVIGSGALIALVVGIALLQLFIRQQRDPAPIVAHVDPTSTTSGSAPPPIPMTSAAPSASTSAATDAGTIALHDAGHGGITILDASAPPSPAPTGPHSMFVQYISSTDCCETATVRTGVDAQLGALIACANASPPSDPFPMYDLRVTPAGAVTSVAPLGAKPGNAAFHSCMQGVLRRVSVGPTEPKCPGSLQVGFKVR